MTGIIVQLAISWLLIWLFEKKGLGVMGFRPTKQRLIDFILFFVITSLCCASGFLLHMLLGARWKINPSFNGHLLINGLWWNIKSVLFEELIFRGVIFYILINRIGATKAIIVSSIAFGIYHWFSYELFWNVKQMIMIFIFTGLVGALYAYGYVKTMSLYATCAMHLAWNFTANFVFSNGNIGKGVLIIAEPAYIVTVSYFVYFLIGLFPMISQMVICFLILKKRKPQASTK